MARDVTFGIRLKADGSGFVGEVKLAGDTVEKFGRSVEKAGAATDRTAKDMEKSLRGAATVGTLLGNVIADIGRAAVTALPNLIGQLDDLDKRAQGLGTTAVALSELSTGARLAGVSAGQFEGALARLNQRLADAAAGGKESAAIFKAMGIKVVDVNGDVRSGTEVLGEMADKFREWRDGPEKGALAMELFGKAAGPRMVAYLNQGSDALRVNSGVTTELVEQAKAAQQEIERLQVEFERFRNLLLGDVLPVIRELIGEFNDGREAAGGFLRAIALIGTTNPLKTTAEQVRDLGEELKELREIQAGTRWDNWMKALRDPGAAGRISETEQLRAYFLARQRAEALAGSGGVLDARDAMARGGGRGAAPNPARGGAGSGGRAGGRAPREERDDYARLADQIRERIALGAEELEVGGKLTAAEQMRIKVLGEVDAGRVRLIAGTREELAALLDLNVEVEREVDARREAAEWAAKVNEAARRQAEERAQIEARAQQDLERFLADVEMEIALVGQSNAVRQQAILLRHLEAQGIERGSAAYEKALPLIEEAGKRMQALEDTERVQGAIDEAARAGARFGESMVLYFGNAGDAVKQLEQDLLRLGTRLLVTEPLENFLRGAMSGKGSGPGAAAGASLFSELAGGAGSSGMWDWVGNAFISAFGMHGGGIAGRDSSFTRAMPAAMFRRAPRLHSGGLAAGEVPAVLQAGEEVLTRRDPRHRMNGGRSVNVTINMPAGSQPMSRQTMQQMSTAFGRAMAENAERGLA